MNVIAYPTESFSFIDNDSVSMAVLRVVTKCHLLMTATVLIVDLVNIIRYDLSIVELKIFILGCMFITVGVDKSYSILMFRAMQILTNEYIRNNIFTSVLWLTVEVAHCCGNTSGLN